MASKDKVFYFKNTLNINGILTDLSTPKIMGILNVTDDSFYDGGKYLNDKEISIQTEKLISEGADIIDIGGYSSRPGSKHLDGKSELDRVLKGIMTVRNISKDIPISIDTFRSSVAQKSIEAGASLVNDISGGSLDENMIKTLVRYNVPYILMHMLGTPQNMMKKVDYKNIKVDIIDYFNKKLTELTQFGIKDVIIDVGFGFSKTTSQNYNLLSFLECFKFLNVPILVGISRKSMIYNVLKSNPSEALNGTSVLNSISLIKGAHILRVHDVKEAKEVVNLIKLISS